MADHEWTFKDRWVCARCGWREHACEEVPPLPSQRIRLEGKMLEDTFDGRLYRQWVDCDYLVVFLMTQE